MHKGIIILVESDNREDAISEVESFLERYGDGNIWDWYQVGGRWHNTLAPTNQKIIFNEFIEELFKDERSDNGFLLQKTIDDKKDVIQAKWDELGLIGDSPYNFNQYKMDGKMENSYNSVPLIDCIDTVKEWVKDLDEEKEKLFEKLVEERRKEKDSENPRYGMSGYYARRYSDAQYGDFCFDTNVYNATDEEGETIPEHIEDYYAVMIDIHN